MSVLSVFTALLEAKAAGKIAGLLVSKTVAGATVASVAGIIPFITPALQGDPAAIGNLVLIIGGWLFALYGRWRAGKVEFLPGG